MSALEVGMPLKRVLLGLFLAIAAAAPLSCAWRDATGSEANCLAAAVSIPPQAYFLERVGGERVSIQVLVGPGQSPATYEPTGNQMALLAKTDVYFRIGVPFEAALLAKIASGFPRLRVVDTRAGVVLQPIRAAANHGAGGREREVMDPHIWLDPRRVVPQARTVCRTLVELDPEGRALYERNLAAFIADLERVDAAIAGTLAPFRGRELFVLHPAYGYFAAAYGLEQVPIEVEGKEPGTRQLRQLVQAARRRGVRALFIQPEFAGPTAKAIAGEIGAAVIPLDPLARSYLTNLEMIAAEIRRGLE